MGRRRALGQHFLTNLPAARRMVELFGPSTGEMVIEIGPGRGVLTELLIEAGARVTAVEVDPRLAADLRERLGHHSGFRLIEADILRCDIGELAAGGPARAIANLPYSITGEALMRLFAASTALTGMMLMLQREVVNRLVATPGGRVYGSLSVLAQYFTEPYTVMTLKPGSFTPPPAVSSTVVAMPFRKPRELSPAVEPEYPPFIRLLFAQRRRTLLNNLKASGRPQVEDTPGAAAVLGRAGIDPERRPETLSREECLRLFAEYRAACG